MAPRLATLAVALLWTAGCAGLDETAVRSVDRAEVISDEAGGSSSGGAGSGGEATTTTTATPGTTTTSVPEGPPSDQRTLAKVQRITGGLTPKSVVYDGQGRMFAQNMVYGHTINVYDRSFQRVAVIPDTVDLSAFGYSSSHQGGPVEAAASADRKHMYVTNYQMYGPGFDNPGDDKCAKGNWDPSFVYRIDGETLAIDQIIEVGAVPKYIATSPDGRWLLNSNWCGYDLSVVDVASAKEVRKVPLGRFPRGIAVTPDSRFAYVAVMGSKDIAKVDLDTFAVTWISAVGSGPRHLVISPDGRWLYATLNGDAKIAKIDTATDTVVQRVATGAQPRSMAISRDGSALYVVNYAVDRMTKLATSDLRTLQTVPTDHHPIGIDYDPGTDSVWVAAYSGSLTVFEDR